MASGSRFIIGLFCGGVVFFLLTGVQYAHQQSVHSLQNVSTKQAEPKQTKTYSSPLLGVLSKIVDKTKGLDPNDKETALDILQKADPLLKKIRAENAKALQRINSPVRLRGRSPRKQVSTMEFQEGI